MFFKIGFLKNIALITEKHLCWSLFLISCRSAPKQVFSCEYCEIFKKSFFTEHLLPDCYCLTSTQYSVMMDSLALRKLSDKKSDEIRFKKCNSKSSIPHWEWNLEFCLKRWRSNFKYTNVYVSILPFRTGDSRLEWIASGLLFQISRFEMILACISNIYNFFK